MDYDDDGKVLRCVRTGKCCFTKRAAQGILNRARRDRRRGKKIPRRIYECQFCGFWHLTHKTRAREIRRWKHPERRFGRLDEI